MSEAKLYHSYQKYWRQHFLNYSIWKVWYHSGQTNLIFVFFIYWSLLSLSGLYVLFSFIFLKTVDNCSQTNSSERHINFTELFWLSLLRYVYDWWSMAYCSGQLKLACCKYPFLKTSKQERSSPSLRCRKGDSIFLLRELSLRIIGVRYSSNEEEYWLWPDKASQRYALAIINLKCFLPTPDTTSSVHLDITTESCRY